MKRTGQLFEQIADHDNLRLALGKALMGKRDHADAREFAAHLDTNLRQMQSGLLDGTIPVGQFHQFVIHDPKERIITAPCFRERVLHHAIMNVCEPVFDRWLIADTYASRRGKGRIQALLRAREFAGRHGYFLKLDMRRYFDSISHAELRSRLAKLFKDRRLLDLFGKIIAGYRADAGRGLPIGSLTSQHFANFYLGWFDRFVKETLRIRGYVRYMDDVAIWGNSAASLRATLNACRSFLSDELQLTLKAEPYMNRTDHGMDYLGCRVFRHHIVLNARSRRRFRRNVAQWERRFLRGEINEDELQRHVEALVAFTRTDGVSSWRFRQAVLQHLPVSSH